MRTTLRGMTAGAAACAVLGLAACGSAVASGGGQHGGTAGSGARTAAGAAAGGVCGHRRSLDKVVISRTPGMMTSSMKDFLPLAEVVTKGSAVRGLAAALCALPAVPKGAISCPADFGASYRFVFSTPAQAFKAVEMQASGCRTITGIGPARSWARAPGVWQALHTAVSSGRLLLPLKQGSVPTPR